MLDHPILPHLVRFGATFGQQNGTLLPLVFTGPGAAGPDVGFDVELGNHACVRLRAYRLIDPAPARSPGMFLQALATTNYTTRLVKLTADAARHLLVAHVDLLLEAVPPTFGQVKHSLVLLHQVIKHRGDQLAAVWRTGAPLSDSSEVDALMSRLVVASLLAAVQEAARAPAPRPAAPPHSAPPARPALQPAPARPPAAPPPRRSGKDFSFESVLNDAIHSREADSE